MAENLESTRGVEVLPTDTPERFAAAVIRAADLLRAGEVVALPTETVYGLAANALDPLAVRRLYTVKGRPAGNPVIVHVATGAMARACAREWPVDADRLAASFWPGPLTLVVPRSGRIPDEVTAGGDTVGIRWPSHPLIQAVIRACGFPLAAPSANRSNCVSPTQAAHVVASLGDRIPLVVDGGACQVGIESTVLDLGTVPPRILRPGTIHEESLAAVLGSVAMGGDGAKVLRSPGQLPRHYAPQGRVGVLRWRDDADLARQMRERGWEPAGTHVLAHERVPSAGVAARVCVIPHDAEAFARALYAEWHGCDALGARWIVVEAVPEGAVWGGVADRLRRAEAAGV
ncbi:MAG: threonylcarbamoyl-AMP synthase [Verrucomicrobiae bacterium]|nr:threonylcarbamoyl-AMP synthase [Verrucomicrobiae bacterium]